MHPTTLYPSYYNHNQNHTPPGINPTNPTSRSEFNYPRSQKRGYGDYWYRIHCCNVVRQFYGV